MHRPSRAAAGEVGVDRAVHDAEGIDREGADDPACQSENDGARIGGTDRGRDDFSAAAVDDVVAILTGRGRVHRLRVANTNGVSIQAARADQERRVKILGDMEQCLEDGVGGRQVDQQPIGRSIIRERHIEGQSGGGGPGDVGERARKVVGPLPLVADKGCGRRRQHRSDERQADESVFVRGQLRRRSRGDVEPVHVRIAGSLEETSGQIFTHHGQGGQRHVRQPGARIDGAHDDLHVITTATFLEEAFQVVGRAVGQRENGGGVGSDPTQARPSHISTRDRPDRDRVGSVVTGNHHALGCGGAVRVHEQLAAVIRADIELVETVARGQEVAGDPRAVKIQAGLSAELAGPEVVRVIGDVREVVDELWIVLEVGHQGACDVGEEFHIHAPETTVAPRAEVDGRVGSDGVAGQGRVAYAIHRQRINRVERLRTGAQEHPVAVHHVIGERVDDQPVDLVVGEAGGGERVHRLAEGHHNRVAILRSRGAEEERRGHIRRHRDSAGDSGHAEEVGNDQGINRAIIRGRQRLGDEERGIVKHIDAVLEPHAAEIRGRTANPVGDESHSLAFVDRGVEREETLAAAGLGEADPPDPQQIGGELQHVGQNNFLSGRHGRITLRAHRHRQAVAAAAFAPTTFHVVALPTDEADVLPLQGVGGIERRHLPDETRARRVGAEGGVGVRVQIQLRGVIRAHVELVIAIRGRNEIAVDAPQIVVQAGIAEVRGVAEVFLVKNGVRLFRDERH